MSAVTIGQVIGGKYRVIRLLGSGGMGAVYEAENPEIDQRVALKILTVDIQANPGLGQRFLNEARAANKIKHPGVAKVHDFGILDTGTIPWMAVEFLEGESLASRLEAALQLPGSCLGMDSWWMIGEMASVLDAAHAQMIVHRDVKPANAMLVPDPRAMHGEHVKLLDFGIAKMRGDDLTKSGVLLGTPVYMAPEQFRAAAEVDGKADIHALGVIAFQILSGRLPFEVKGAYELMAAKCFDFPTPLDKYAPHLPPEILSFVMRMLERDPTARPTAAEVEAEVRRTIGLPPSRQTGGHNLPVAPSAMSRPKLDTSGSTLDAENDKTPSLSEKASAAVQAALGPTPSEQRAVGQLEPSPKGVNVPISLSSIPSVPMSFAPPRRVVENESTAQKIVAPLAAATSSPSSPTVRDEPRRRPLFYLAAAVLAVVAAGSAAVAWWPSRGAAPTPPSTVGPAQPTPAPAAPQPAPAATQPAPATPPPTLPSPPPTATGSVPAADHNPGPNPALQGAQKTSPEKPVRTPARSSERGCVNQVPVDTCIVTDLDKTQRARVLSAIKSSGVKWCRGESVVLGGFPHYPKILEAPTSLNPESAPALKLTGLLHGANLPERVELKCRAR